MSVTIPGSWTAASPSPSYGQTTWTFEGLGGEVQLTASALAFNSFQLLPMVFTPPGTGLHRGPTAYQDQLDVAGSVTRDVLSRAGTLYSIAIDGGPTRRILASWHHPPVATVTQAVHLMEQSTVNQGAPEYTKVFANAADGWILAGGEPAASQEAYYLFRTVNGGKTWALERYTAPAGCPTQVPSRTFIAGDGWAGMAFWSADEGIIVNASAVVAQAVIIRTRNGGQTWTTQTISLPASATGGHIRNQHGILTLTLDQPQGARPVTLKSTDDGTTWTHTTDATAAR